MSVSTLRKSRKLQIAFGLDAALTPRGVRTAARVAVLLSFDVDNDTIKIARNENPSIGGMS